jgi:hypothetical protein
MSNLNELFLKIDNALVAWMKNHGILWLRVSLGVIFLWFGMLKFFPGLSPCRRPCHFHHQADDFWNNRRSDNFVRTGLA